MQLEITKKKKLKPSDLVLSSTVESIIAIISIIHRL